MDNNVTSKSIYFLDENFIWTTEGSELPTERIKHCSIQINDCEVAFIGGERGDINDDNKIIDIWNYKKGTWRIGPRYIVLIIL